MQKPDDARAAGLTEEVLTGADADAVVEATPRTAGLSDDQAKILELAALPELEYSRQRKKAANDLGIQVAALDREVKRVRKTSDATDQKSGRAVVFPEIEPWPDEVNGADLLASLAATFKKYLIMPPWGAEACALWVVATYMIEAIFNAAILAFTGPTKRCGKTRGLEILIRLVLKGLPAASITPAALFRVVESWSPTLLIDELDRVKDDEGLTQLLNAGTRRDTAVVIRVETTPEGEFEPRKFSVFAFKAVALIGLPTGTVADRSILIRMARKAPGEKVAPLDFEDNGPFIDLQRRCVRWASDHLSDLRGARPEPASGLNDRAQDGWRPLLAIADIAGGSWPTDARKAALALSGNEASDDQELGVRLLGDLRMLFERDGVEVYPADRLCGELAKLTEAPWDDLRGKAIKPQKLASLLRPFGVASRQTWSGDRNLRSYHLADLAPQFSRYLPRGGVQGARPLDPSVDAAKASFEDARTPEPLASQKVRAAAPMAESSGLADLLGGVGGIEREGTRSETPPPIIGHVEPGTTVPAATPTDGHMPDDHVVAFEV